MSIANRRSREDDAYHSDRDAHQATFERIRSLPVNVVNGGHFPSFGPTRYRQIIGDYLKGLCGTGCHLTTK